MIADGSNSVAAHACVKCGSQETPHLEYRERFDRSGNFVEYLRCFCPTCGYAWSKACLDADRQKEQPIGSAALHDPLDAANAKNPCDPASVARDVNGAQIGVYRKPGR